MSMEQTESKMDSVKWVAVAVLVAVAVIGDNQLAIENGFYRLLGLLAIAGVSAFIALQTSKGKNARGFAHDAYGEARKVVWPSRAETTQTTGIVMFAVLIMGIFLYLVDMLLGFGVEYLTSLGG